MTPSIGTVAPPTAARLTPAGRGAVATVRICGIAHDLQAREIDPALPNFERLNRLFHAANGLRLVEQPSGKIAFGQWGLADAEDLVVCRTAPDAMEIHCHGGEAAVRRVLDDLANAGCRVVEWFDQVVDNSGLIDAECQLVLSRTSTWRTTKFALQQASGLLKNSFQQFVDFENRSVESLVEAVDRLLEWSDFGLHLSTPWNVVLTGRPNVGKSSLINALLGYQRAIVFDQPGTTRDVVTGETAFDGWPVVLADTAGLRDADAGLEAAGIELARERLRSADLRLVLLDVSQVPTAQDEQILAEWPDSLVVGHKADLENRWGSRLPRDAILVSSVTNAGLSDLQRVLVNRLVPKVPMAGSPIPVTIRQVEALRVIRAAATADERREGVERLIYGTLNPDREG